MSGPDGLTVRAATPRDADWLRGLHRASHAEVKERAYDAYDRGWDDGFFVARIAHPDGVLVAARGGEDVGAAYLEERDDAICVEAVEVRPEHQGEGIGSSLLRLVKDRAVAGGQSVTIRVHSGNEAALRLYEHRGFRVVEESGGQLLMRWPAPAREAAISASAIAASPGPGTAGRSQSSSARCRRNPPL